MHFQTIFTAGLLHAAAVSAINYATPPNAGRNDGANYCSVSYDIDDQYGLHSCSEEDVQGLVDQFKKNPDFTTTISTNWNRVGTYGSCAFSIVVVPGQPGGNSVLIGGGDLWDLSEDAVNKVKEVEKATGGWVHPRIDESGTMPCDQPGDGGHFKQLWVMWIIASSADNPPQPVAPKGH